MTRDDVKAALGTISQVHDALGNLPYKDALPVAAKLKELADLIGEELPGGLFGSCESCERLLGNDDDFSSSGDDGYFCADCISQMNDPFPIPAVEQST